MSELSEYAQRAQMCSKDKEWCGVFPLIRQITGLSSTVESQKETNLALCNKVAFGAVIAIAELVDCVQIEKLYSDRINGTNDCLTVPFKAKLNNGQFVTGNELKFGDFTPGRYAWILANVRRIDPVPAKGKQRIWEWEENE